MYYMNFKIQYLVAFIASLYLIIFVDMIFFKLVGKHIFILIASFYLMFNTSGSLYLKE